MCLIYTTYMCVSTLYVCICLYAIFVYNACVCILYVYYMYIVSLLVTQHFYSPHHTCIRIHICTYTLYAQIQGGRATNPLRYWSEAQFPPEINKGIKDAGYETPSPIQRQAVPIGLSGRDIIGIAETGSGKVSNG